jgi:hypothetical protein
VKVAFQFIARLTLTNPVHPSAYTQLGNFRISIRYIEELADERSSRTKVAGGINNANTDKPSGSHFD